MPDFHTLKNQLLAARKAQEEQQLKLLQAKEKLNKVKRLRAQSKRTTNNEVSIEGAVNNLRDHQSRFEESQAATRLRETAFEAFTDPRRHLPQWSDQFPILLFPLRIETRFKTTTTVNGVQRQLWVRVFPDDCSVDHFDPTLSEVEIRNAKSYWQTIWAAGVPQDEQNEGVKDFIKNQVQAAWRGLTGTLQAGRAYWITQNYLPLNLEQEVPQRASKQDLILVIPTENAPTPDEKTALQHYWTDFYLAAQDKLALEAAFLTLVNTIGSEAAAMALLEAYSPIPIDPALTENLLRENIQVQFLIFPAAETQISKASSWSQAARSQTLPDRFVFMGYQGDLTTPTVQALGNLIPDPLVVGPDPSMDIDAVLRTAYGAAFDHLQEEEKVEKYIEYLSQQSETKWLFDFEAAVAQGMGFKIDLSREQYNQGFDRILVLGVKLSADQGEGQRLAERWLEHHHYGNEGVSFIPQGTPTNNTGKAGSGYADEENPLESFEQYFATPENHSAGHKPDGLKFAALLGINPAAAAKIQHYHSRDQIEAKAMNQALWPATFGYFMETMMQPLFSDTTIKQTKSFFTNYVSGRGALPAMRIGDQPYGILPTTAFSKIKWFDREVQNNDEQFANEVPFFGKLYNFLRKLQKDWESLVPRVAHVGKTGDAHKILLEILGLHSGSVAFHQRYAKSYFHLYNWLLLSGYGGNFGAINFSPIFSGNILAGTFKLEGTRLLPNVDELKKPSDGVAVEILEKFFHARANELKGALIDDVPLSETKPIRAYTDDDKNYLEWLIDAAKTSHGKLQRQAGFTDNQRPTALLYIMLQHALHLSFLDASLDLHQQSDLLSATQVKSAKLDAKTIGIKAHEEILVESKLAYLDKKEFSLTNEDISIGDYIAQSLGNNRIAPSLSPVWEQLQAIQQLAQIPTARLERAFVEHLDCCSYRLDAWLMGLVNYRLSQLRQLDNEDISQQGLYLGAFGWLTEIRPENKELIPATLSPELAQIFNPGGDETLVSDKTNAGYVHAPSLNHAVTAAVLRNGYISNASPTEPDLMKVNLSSERVRLALSIIEGMQQGQSLSALLGYQLERGLHDRYQMAEVDLFIYELRKVFPLRANRLGSTTVEDDALDSIIQIEARNVVDGLALIEHIKSTGIGSYPFGKNLAEATPAQRNVINTEVERIIDIEDAVADLAMAESVHQVVQNNYDRAAGTLAAFSKGAYPQTPEVIRTPRSGVNLLHRVGLHLEADIDPALGLTAKAQAAPSLNQWLAAIFPPLAAICCQVDFLHAPVPYHVSMADLNLSPIDVLYLLDLDGTKNLATLDDLILRHVHTTQALKPDVAIQIQYTKAVTGQFSFFEVAALAKSLRALLLSSRPLKASDLKLQTEAQVADDQAIFLDPARIALPFAQLKTFRTDLNNQVTLMSNFVKEDLAETTLQKDPIINQIDTFLDQYTALLQRGSMLGLSETGFGFAYEQRSSIYQNLLQTITTYRDRWLTKEVQYQALQNEVIAAITEEAALEILQRAERCLSTQNTIPLPNTTLAYQAILTTKKLAFDQKIITINAILNNTPATLTSLFTMANQLITDAPSLLDFDLVPLELAEPERQALVLATDLLQHLQKVLLSLDERIPKIETLLIAAQNNLIAQEKVNHLLEAGKLLFGKEFKMIPSFACSEPQAAELQQCWTDRNAILNYQQNDLATDFPVDDWLYGVARVREKMSEFENSILLSESLAQTNLSLTPIQLPYLADDHWLALRYPENYQIDNDKLLYTAHHAIPFDPSQRQSGLLLDEWTEVIPSVTETTGLTFHYDQPNSEPPQTMLLAVSPNLNGQWKWEDLVASLHETFDLAKLRAVEPVHLDQTTYTRFLPATVAAVNVRPISIMMNYAINNGIVFQSATLNEDE